MEETLFLAVADHELFSAGQVTQTENAFKRWLRTITFPKRKGAISLFSLVEQNMRA